MNTNPIGDHDSNDIDSQDSFPPIPAKTTQRVVGLSSLPAAAVKNTGEREQFRQQLNQMNVPELRQLAKELNVPRQSRLNKPKLIAALLQQSAEQLQERLTAVMPGSPSGRKTSTRSFLRRVATQLSRFGWKRTVATAVVIVGTPIGLVSDSTTIISNWKLLFDSAPPSSVATNPTAPATPQAVGTPAPVRAGLATSPSKSSPATRPATTSHVRFPSALNIGQATTVLIEQPVGRPEWINALELEMITRESGPLDEVDKKKVVELRKAAAYTSVFKNCCLLSNEFEASAGAQVKLTAKNAHCAVWATCVNLDTHQQHVLTNTAILNEPGRAESVLLGSLPATGRHVVLLYLFPLNNESISPLGLNTIAEADDLTLAINSPVTLTIDSP